jgi:hypothetical protein
MMLLGWRMPDPPLVVQWRGPTGSIAALAASNPPTSIPTVIGPPGPAGPPGTVADIDGGTFN